MGTQTTGSDHYFVARGEREREEEDADAYGVIYAIFLNIFDLLLN